MEENRKKTTCNRIFGARKNTPSETGRSLVGRCNKGFTLVELIVVLIVLAIVAAIVVPALLGFNDKGKEATYKMEAQKALAATQTALSDIYNDAGNQLNPEKRQKIKKLAGAGDNTEFTVWTEATLKDGFTTATTENIGSYTVKEAIYKATDKMYFLYDGKNWKTYESYNEAAAALTANKNNVIYVWPYDGSKQDFAYINGGNGSGQTVSPDDDSPNIKVVDLKLDPDNKGHVYYEREGRPGSAGKEYVSIVFWKDGDTVESYWYIDALDERDRFKVDEYYTYKLHMDKGYYFAGWKNEAGEIIFDATGVALTGTVKPIDGKTYIENIIFAAGNESKKNFSFTMMIGKDDNFFDELTVDKEEFSGLITSDVKYITKVPTDDYTLEQVMALAAANNGARTDVEGAASPQMYSWVEGDTLKWWSDASVVYLPSDCSGFFKDKTGLTSFDFSDFNTIKVDNMSSMFEGCGAITDITLGTSFNANLVTSANSMFKNCSSLTTIDIGNFNAADGKLEDVAYMFNGCTEVTELSFGENFNTQNISSSSDGFKSMFDGCKNATTIDVTNFNTANVTDISYMFNGCEAVTGLNLSGWNPANFTRLDHAFCNMNALVNIDFGSNWSNLTKVTTMASAFDGCILLSNDFSKFKVTGSSLTDMSCAFRNCFTLSSVDLSGWNVSKVTTMSEMFSMYNPYDAIGSSSLTSVNTDGWNTGSLTDMSSIFRSCTALETIDISGWNLSKVTTLAYSFAGATSLTKVTLPAECELTACTTLESAFQGCTSLDQTFAELKTTNSLASIKNTFDGCTSLRGLNLEGWNTSGITTTDGFTGTFIDCSLLKDIYATVDFVVPSNCYSAVMFGGNTVLVGGHGTSWATEQDNSAKKAWLDRRDGRGDAKGYFIDRNDIDSYAQIVALEEHWPTTKYGIISSKANITGFERYTGAETVDELTTYLTGKNIFKATDNSFAPSMDSTKTNPAYYNMTNVDSESGEAKPYQVYFWAEGGIIKWWSDARYVYINPGTKGTSQKMFMNWNNIDTINLDGLDFSKVIDLSKVFSGCSNLTAVNGLRDAFHDNNVITTTENMFLNCYKLKAVDLSKLNNGNTLTNTKNMFGGCAELSEINLGSLNTSEVTTMESMFSGCKKLSSLDLTSFNTSKVQSFMNMFNNCKVLTTINVDKTKFTASNAKSLNRMFVECNSLLTIDLSGFSTGSVTDMYGMFKNCTVIDNLDFSKFDTASVTDMSYMFAGCEGLRSLDLSTFNTANVTKMAAMFSWCQNLETLKINKVNFDTSKVGTKDNISNIGKMDGHNANAQSFEFMFFHCHKLESIDVSGFNTSNAHSMYKMFDQCRSIKSIDVSGFDTSNVRHMGNMFFLCISLKNIDISNFSSDSLTICSKMFCMYDKDYPEITDNALESITFGENFTCENVTNMSQMFQQCKHLVYLELTNFNTVNLTNTSDMFRDCLGLEGIYVTDPDDNEGKGFFYKTTSGLTRPISSSSNMFLNCGKLSGIVTSVAVKKKYDATYACVDKTGQEGYFKGGRMPAQLVKMDENWLLSVTTKTAKSTITRFERNTTLTKSEVLDLYNAGTAKDLHDKTFSDVPVYFWVDNKVVKWWSEASIVYVNPDTMYMFTSWSNVKIVDLQGLDFSKQLNFGAMFRECQWLGRIIDRSGMDSNDSDDIAPDYAINTASAGLDSSWAGDDNRNDKGMNYMFNKCSRLKSVDLSLFNTSRIISMRSMFCDCAALTSININSFDLSNAKYLRYMFQRCNNLSSITMDKIDTSSVITMENLFDHCAFNSIDISNFKSDNLKEVQSMFWACSNLKTIKFGPGFKCEKVEFMQSMFCDCPELTELDLRYFNTLKLKQTCKVDNADDPNKWYGMFKGCSKLETIYVSDPEENDGYGFYSHVAGYGRTNIADNKSTYMFYGCSSLVGGNTENPTHYDSNHVNAEYARVDKDGQPGYFTAASRTTYTKIVPLDANWVSSKLGGTKKTSITNFERYTSISTEEQLLTHVSGKKYAEISDSTYMDASNKHYNVYVWVEGTVIYWWSAADYVYVATLDSGFDDGGNANNIVNNYGMFSGWEAVTDIDLQGFDFSTVNFFTAMFAECKALQRIYDGSTPTNENYKFDTRAATNMMYMFHNCTTISSIDLSSFTTDNVQSLHNMFRGCAGLTTIDLSTFNTSNVTDTGSMFKNCSKLVTVYVTDPLGNNTPAGKGFVTDNITASSQMFSGCSKIVGGAGTTFNGGKVDKTYARVDRKNEDPSVPGYFTAK